MSGRKSSHGELLLTLHFTLCECLVALCMHVYYATLVAGIWGRLPQSQRNVRISQCLESAHPK